jgi:hypothetical protein
MQPMLCGVTNVMFCFVLSDSSLLCKPHVNCDCCVLGGNEGANAKKGKRKERARSATLTAASLTARLAPASLWVASARLQAE